ncbi:WG repeat-containing protein [Flavobacterium sp. MMS24-S5]|uniref:WG repeat-containing protein n=1 Tax=Flavobacterium sp. MMS24-S5 TaxID=3416605 RepID=UPI003D018D20
MKKSLVFLLLSCIQFVNSQELALVKKNSKIGYISKDGSFKIEPQYKSARSFSEGLAAVENGGKWGFIDAKGTWVIPADFKDAKDFNSGIAVVQKEKDWVYINTKGEIQK